MPISFLPVIKVLDVSDVELPIKVTATRRSDGNLWWKHTPAVPRVMHKYSEVQIASYSIQDRMNAYQFSQTLFNLLLFNTLQLHRPQKFTFTVENDAIQFTYYVDEDEVIFIPRLPRNGQLLRFTLVENFPVLKLHLKLQ